MEQNNYRNIEQDRRLQELEKKLEVVFSHIATTNEELAKIKTDVCWLKKFFWIVVVASVDGLIGALINLLITIK